MRTQHNVEPTNQDIQRLLFKITCELQGMNLYIKHKILEQSIAENTWDNTLKQADRIAGIVGRQAENHFRTQENKPSLTNLTQWVDQAQAEINGHQQQLDQSLSYTKNRDEHTCLFKERYGIEPPYTMIYSFNKKMSKHDFLTSYYKGTENISSERAHWIAFNEAEGFSRAKDDGAIDGDILKQDRKQYSDKMESTLDTWGKEHQHDFKIEQQAVKIEHEAQQRAIKIEQEKQQMEQKIKQAESEIVIEKSRSRGFER